MDKKYKYLYANGSSISAGGGFEVYSNRKDVRDSYSKNGIELPKTQNECSYPYEIAKKLGLQLVNDSKCGAGIHRLVRTSYNFIETHKSILNDTFFIFETQSGIRLDIFLKEYNDYLIVNGWVDEDNNIRNLYLVKEWYAQSEKEVSLLNEQYGNKLSEFYENFWNVDIEFKTELRELDMFISYCNELKLDYLISLCFPLQREDRLISKIQNKKLINSYLNNNDIWSYCMENKMLISDEVDNSDNHLGLSGTKFISDTLVNVISSNF